MNTLAELLAAFDEADTAYRSAMAVAQAQSGLDGPMGMFQTQSWPTPDIDATRLARETAVRTLRDCLVGDQGRLAQLDIYVDLRHDPSAQVRKEARRRLVG